jgi:hypothetical protein
MYTRKNDKVVKVENFKVRNMKANDGSVIVTNPEDNAHIHKHKHKEWCYKKILISLWLGFFFILLAAPFIFPEYLNMLKTNNIDTSVMFVLHTIIFMLIVYMIL